MISACMTVSVRELRTAVREWACWQSTACNALKETETDQNRSVPNLSSTLPLSHCAPKNLAQNHMLTKMAANQGQSRVKV